MDDRQKRGVLFITAFIALALLLRWIADRRAAAVTAAVEPPPQSDFTDPLLWPTPGIYPDAEGFQSVINVNVGTPLAIGGNQYVPTFGLIGMVGVKAM